MTTRSDVQLQDYIPAPRSPGPMFEGAPWIDFTQVPLLLLGVLLGLFGLSMIAVIALRGRREEPTPPTASP